MLNLFVHNEEVPLKIMPFPAGETLVRIEDTRTMVWEDCRVRIKMDFRSNDDIVNLMLLVDAVRREYPSGVHLTLDMPYMPYARQDRVCNPGESLSVKVIADLINSLKFDRVICEDLHSDVSGALLNNLEHVEQPQCGMGVLSHMPPDIVLVSPDAGANKKVFAFAKAWGCRDVVRADKIRDTKTGAILETKVYTDGVDGRAERDYLILDDICEGGRTFIELSKELRKVTTGKIFLYVTHGIFSKGLDPLLPHFNGIFTSNLMCADDVDASHVTVV